MDLDIVSAAVYVAFGGNRMTEIFKLFLFYHFSK
jgi:hypothetical protein